MKDEYIRLRELEYFCINYALCSNYMYIISIYRILIRISNAYRSHHGYLGEFFSSGHGKAVDGVHCAATFSGSTVR